MNDVSFDIVKQKNVDKKFYIFSDIDILNLKNYLYEQNRANGQLDKQNHVNGQQDKQNHSNEQQAEQEYKSVDYYLNQILAESDQIVPNIYQYLQPEIKNVDQEPEISLPFDYYHTFSLEIVTCGMPKDTKLPVPQKNFSLTNGTFGDDVGFTMQKEQHIFLGISDGAGGNAMFGYDPRLFSESLMRNCSTLASTGKYSTTEPKRLLCHAFDRVQIENCFGSATACIIGVDGDTGRLYSVNIGDSGYVILRQGYVIYRSKSQEMNGDSPRQLDVYPWTASLKGQGLNYTEISVFDAICQTFDLEFDDIIILSTDGLFDNVSDHLIEQILSQSPSLKHAINALVTRAVRSNIKPDDVLVIMARVIANNNYIHKQGE